MKRDQTVIPVMMDQEEVAYLFQKYDLTSAPVVDESGRLSGMVTIDDVVDVIMEQADKSLLGLAGLAEDEDTFAPIFKTVRSRIRGNRWKFDPDGIYVREYVPEIAALPDKYIHHPWDAPNDVLEDAGITLGETYPKPIVDHKEARERALSAFDTIKEAS